MILAKHAKQISLVGNFINSVLHVLLPEKSLEAHLSV